MTAVTVLIPLGGVGRRFAREGYTDAKPFIPVMGKPMIVWVLESLRTQKDDTIAAKSPGLTLLRSVKRAKAAGKSEL